MTDDNFATSFRSRMKQVGSTRYDRNFRNKSREFNNYFENALDKETCYIDGVEVQAVFQDQSQSNNKDLSDDKYLILPNEIDCHVGSYIAWRNELWLVFTGEFKTIPTHQQFKIKHVNKSIKWITDYSKRTISNDGQGWGAYVQNQTLYTLGVSFTGKHVALANAKMMLYVQNNEETKKITLGSRFYLSGQVYKVEFVDTISRIGLINLLLAEDTKNNEIDNDELEIADYWKPKEKEDSNDKNNDDSQATSSWSIVGEKTVKLARSYVYKVMQTNPDGTQEQLKVQEWDIESIENVPFYILEKDEDTLQLRVIDDARNVGKLVNIMAHIDGKVQNLTVKIAAKFS